jgi:hypothetical protein
MKRRVILDTLMVGGLHKDHFEWAFEQYQEAGYVLICFGLDFDGYHWKAVYVKASAVEKLLGEGGVPSERLCLYASDARRQ